MYHKSKKKAEGKSKNERGSVYWFEERDEREGRRVWIASEILVVL